MPAITRPREWWRRYRSLMEPSAGPIQVSETRKAFIAGMFSAMESIMQTVDLNEDQSMQALDQFQRELNELANEIMRNDQRTERTN